MTVVSFLNNLGLGGTEKAACRWAWGLQGMGHRVIMLTLRDGPRREELQKQGVELRLVDASAHAIAAVLREIGPAAIHVHAPGHPHEGDVLGEALALLPKIPVVQTNVFGHLMNPKEDAWTDFRLFVSWTSCVQAARRTFRRLDKAFFRRSSVAVYPVDPEGLPLSVDIQAFRKQLGVADNEVLLGRLSRPDLSKWTNLAVDAFLLALRSNTAMKLLLREPPPAVAAKLRVLPEARHLIILPATADGDELRLTMAALDVVLHTSSIGESFGYGIAEPMNLAKPVITHSVPWGDQAQIELVRQGECGLIASTPSTMADAIRRLATDSSLRRRLGEAAQRHIRALAGPGISIERIEQICRAALEGRDNPFAAEDLRRAKETAAYLDAHQFGQTFREQLALRPFYSRVRFHEWRRAFVRVLQRN